MLGKAAAGSGRRSMRRRGLHKKLNSMKLINALSLLLLLGFKRRLLAGAERETAALLFIYLFSNARGCYFTSGGAL